jgi:hypothetical protein
VKKQTKIESDDTKSTEEPVSNAALAVALNNAKPLNLDKLDALTDSSAEDLTAWLKSSRGQN